MVATWAMTACINPTVAVKEVVFPLYPHEYRAWLAFPQEHAGKPPPQGLEEGENGQEPQKK